MRRKDREITDRAAIDKIIRRAIVCRLGMCVDGQPYVVPLSFGYRDGSLFFHCAPKGMKLDMLRKNDRVCVEFDIDQKVVRHEHAVKWTMKYRSVIGFGRAVIIKDMDKKTAALDALMAQYSEGTYDYPREVVAKTAIVRIDLESVTGKIAGYDSDED